jgi:glycerophosphoryl diester phosphodiesterase
VIDRAHVVAHRGGAAEAPENTLTAVRTALALAVRAIEIDVRLTADGELAVYHDECVHPQAPRHAGRPIHEITFAELSSLDVGAPGSPESVPRLADVLALPFGRPTRLMIEAKSAAAGADELARRLAEATARSPARAHVLWGSLDPAVARALHRRDPRVPLVAIVAAPHDLESFAGLPAAVFALDKELAQPALVARCRGRGGECWCWTVNDFELAGRFLASGIDAVITDRPRAFIT